MLILARWNKRLGHIKILSGIIVLGLGSSYLREPGSIADPYIAVHRKAAVVCLAVLLYYVFATELIAMLKPKEDDEDEISGLKRKKKPQVSRTSLSFGLLRALHDRSSLNTADQRSSGPWNGDDIHLRANQEGRYEGSWGDPGQSTQQPLVDLYR